MILDGSPIKKLLLRLFSQSPNPQRLFNPISSNSFPFPLMKILQCIFTFRTYDTFPLRVRYKSTLPEQSPQLPDKPKLNKSPQDPNHRVSCRELINTQPVPDPIHRLHWLALHSNQLVSSVQLHRSRVIYCIAIRGSYQIAEHYAIPLRLKK